jgi:hypothetical protein
MIEKEESSSTNYQTKQIVRAIEREKERERRLIIKNLLKD